MKRKKLFRPPHLYDAGGDLSKPWWIEYGYRDPKSGLMVRKRISDGFADLKTKKARHEFAQRLIKLLSDKLNNGWIPDDDRQDQSVYVDEIEYHQAARIYGRKRKANRNIRLYASEYIELIKNTKAKKTFENYRGKLRTLVLWLEKNDIADNDISAVSNDIIIRFFDFLITTEQLSGRTIEKYLVTLKNFFKFLIERKIIAVNPVFGIQLPEVNEDFAAVPFHDDDLNKILPVMRDEDPQLYMAALLQYFCFIRPGDELLTLRVKQINFVTRTIFIPKNVAKNRVARTIDIPAQMHDVLCNQGINTYGKELFVIGSNGRPGTKQIGYNTLRERFNKIRDRLGLSASYKWYSFKHTGAGKLLESGATIAELMNQLGHSDLASTYRYIRRHFGERSEHVRNNFPDPPGMNSKTKCVKNNWLEGLILN